jgi:hypothetical protein
MSDFFIKFANQLDTKRPVQKRLHDIVMLQLGIKNGGAKQAVADAEKVHNWHHLNPEGQRAAKRSSLESYLASNAQARIALKKLRAESDASLPKITPLAKDDIVGHLREQEARALVRGMPQEQRDRAYKLHPEIVGAIARAPAALSGVPESVHTKIVTDALRRTHGAELAKVKADNDAIRWTQELCRETTEEIRGAAEIQHEVDFRMWAGPVLGEILKEAQTDIDSVFARKAPENEALSLHQKMLLRSDG